MPKATATVITTQEVTIKPAIQRRLMTELHGYAQIAAELKTLKSGKEGHSAEVLLLSVAHVDALKYELEGFKVAVVKGALDNRLDKVALLKRLVKDGKYSLKAAQALLVDCTSSKPKKDHVRITAPGETDDTD